VTKEIPLTQGKVALVDDEDYELVVAMGKWHINSGGYAQHTINGKMTNGKLATSPLPNLPPAPMMPPRAKCSWSLPTLISLMSRTEKTRETI